MKWVAIFALAFTLLYGIARAEIIAEWPGTMYVSPDQVTIQWQHSDDDRVTHYEVQAVWIDQNPGQVIDLGTTTSTSMVIERPRTGHFVIRVRSMVSDIETDGGESLKSVWAVSAEKDHTNGNPWRIYFTVPDVGGIEVK